MKNLIELIISYAEAYAAESQDTIGISTGLASEAMKVVREEIAKMEAERDALRAEVVRLREALMRIADPSVVPTQGKPQVLREYAKAALSAGEKL